MRQRERRPGSRRKDRSQSKQEIKTPNKLTAPGCMRFHGQLVPQGLKEEWEKGPCPLLPAPKGRILKAGEFKVT